MNGLPLNYLPYEKPTAQASVAETALIAFSAPRPSARSLCLGPGCRVPTDSPHIARKPAVHIVHYARGSAQPLVELDGQPVCLARPERAAG